MIKPTLTDLGYQETRNRKPYHLYECSCGNRKLIQRQRVRTGETTSCGCWGRYQGMKNITPGNYGARKRPNSKPAHNKGKICIYENNITFTGRSYVTHQELKEMWSDSE